MNINLSECDEIWRESIELHEIAEYQLVNDLI
jgi:hypothetical protein